MELQLLIYETMKEILRCLTPAADIVVLIWFINIY